jgi:hypothetical protein
MDTAKILVVANAPGILQRVEETLAGLEVEVAIRLRDVGAAVSKHEPALLILYLGFEPQSTVELVAYLSAELERRPMAIVCLAPESKGPMSELEAQMRAAGATEFIVLADYPRTPKGDDVLRKRILSAAGEAARATPVLRVLRRAVLIAGGQSKLAAHLDVPEAELGRWLAAQGEPPEAAFLLAFDLVLMDLERGARKPS